MTYRDDRVLDLLEEYVCVKLEASTPMARRVAQKLKVTEAPTQVILDPRRRTVRRITGTVEPEQMAHWLDDALQRMAWLRKKEGPPIPESIPWGSDLASARKKAKEKEKPILLHLPAADADEKEKEKTKKLLGQKVFRDWSTEYVPVRLTSPPKALQEQLGDASPRFVILDEKGNLLKKAPDGPPTKEDLLDLCYEGKKAHQAATKGD